VKLDRVGLAFLSIVEEDFERGFILLFQLWRGLAAALGGQAAGAGTHLYVSRHGTLNVTPKVSSSRLGLLCPVSRRGNSGEVVT